jgi:glycerol kinase
MELDSSICLESLKVDGGACKNDFLMQFQADLIDAPVKRPANVETTALGAAYLAGLAVGFWSSEGDVLSNWSLEREFRPRMSESGRRYEMQHWEQAVAATRGWAR